MTADGSMTWMGVRIPDRSLHFESRIQHATAKVQRRERRQAARFLPQLNGFRQAGGFPTSLAAELHWWRRGEIPRSVHPNGPIAA